VSHCGLAIYIKKYFMAKEELWKFKYFNMQKYNLQNNPLKETKILQDIMTLTNLKFQHKPKYHHVSKILVEKKDLLPRGRNPLISENIQTFLQKISKTHSSGQPVSNQSLTLT
jgi:hypothetical protein